MSAMIVAFMVVVSMGHGFHIPSTTSSSAFALFDSKGLFDQATTVSSTFFDRVKRGDPFKLAVADALASLSPYDAQKILDENLLIAKSHPVVMFEWTVSPACVKAKKLLKLAGVEPYLVQLDQPWDKGNPIRAVLGRHLKKSSVPMIFIDGKYIGGCEDGVSDEAPGLVPLAFKNELYGMLLTAGAFNKPASKVIPAPSETVHAAKEVTSASTESVLASESSVDSAPSVMDSLHVETSIEAKEDVKEEAKEHSTIVHEGSTVNDASDASSEKPTEHSSEKPTEHSSEKPTEPGSSFLG